MKAILWNMPDSELHCEKAHARQVEETPLLLKGKLPHSAGEGHRVQIQIDRDRTYLGKIRINPTLNLKLLSFSQLFAENNKTSTDPAQDRTGDLLRVKQM